MGKYRAPDQTCSGLLCTATYCTEINTETAEGVEDESTAKAGLLSAQQRISELFAFLTQICLLMEIS